MNVFTLSEELEKTDLYAKLYRQQEKITREQLSVFAVSSKTPQGLFAKVPNKMEQESQGIYRIDLFFRSVLLLVPNEMKDKEANDVFELFASQKSQYFQAIRRMASNPFWRSLTGMGPIFLQRLGKELKMAGLTMDQLARREVLSFMEHVTPEQFAEVIEGMPNKTEALEEALNRLSQEEKKALLEKLQAH